MGKVISRERERERATINLERGTKVGVRYEYGTLTVIYYYFTVLNNTKIERYNRENNRGDLHDFFYTRGKSLVKLIFS